MQQLPCQALLKLFNVEVLVALSAACTQLVEGLERLVTRLVTDANNRPATSSSPPESMPLPASPLRPRGIGRSSTPASPSVSGSGTAPASPTCRENSEGAGMPPMDMMRLLLVLVQSPLHADPAGIGGQLLPRLVGLALALSPAAQQVRPAE